MKASVNLYFTTSKFLAYLVLLIGTTYAFIFHDSNVLIATFAAASSVIAVKTYTQSKAVGKSTTKKEEEIDV